MIIIDQDFDWDLNCVSLICTKLGHGLLIADEALRVGYELKRFEHVIEQERKVKDHVRVLEDHHIVREC